MIARASQEVRSGIIYATAIIILVFVPLFALSGIEGRLFAPLGVAYIVSILASLVTSITVTPVLCYYLLPQMRRLSHGNSWLVTRLKAGNRRLLDWAFGQQAFLMAAATCAVVVAALSATLLPRSFLPPFNEGTLTISMLLAAWNIARRVQPRRAYCRASAAADTRSQNGGTAHRSGGAGRARGRRALGRDRRRPGALAPEPRGDRHRDQVAARHAAGLHQCRPAHLAPPRSHAVRGARADRAQDLRRGPRHAARACRANAEPHGIHQGTGGPAGRAPGAHSSGPSLDRLPEGRHVRRDPVTRDGNAGNAAERPRRLADHRWQPAP